LPNPVLGLLCNPGLEWSRKIASVSPGDQVWDTPSLLLSRGRSNRKAELLHRGPAQHAGFDQYIVFIMK